MGKLSKKLVVVGITGGISAYRTCELVRLLKKAKAEVQVIMTEAGAFMVGPQTFQALSGRPVEVGAGGNLAQSGMAHIDLGQEADIIVVAPATANTIAKMACGMADNLLCATVLSSTCPVLLAPAMNVRMWKNPLTQKNIKSLQKLDRFSVTGPASGDLACGESGPGRMEDPQLIFEAIVSGLSKKKLKGKKILVTAGPTKEAIDPVRYICNRSTGRMGIEVAAAAQRMGADGTLVLGPVPLQEPCGVEVVRVTTAAQMAKAVQKASAKKDAVIMTAAVADFTPQKIAVKKIKKDKYTKSMLLSLKRTEDILLGLGQKKSKTLLVGFAAETGNLEAEAKKKLKAKRLDLIVANDVSSKDSGFEVDTNRVMLISGSKTEKWPLLTKQEVATRLLERVAGMLR